MASGTSSACSDAVSWIASTSILALLRNSLIRSLITDALLSGLRGGERADSCESIIPASPESKRPSRGESSVPSANSNGSNASRQPIATASAGVMSVLPSLIVADRNPRKTGSADISDAPFASIASMSLQSSGMKDVDTKPSPLSARGLGSACGNSESTEVRSVTP